MSQSSSELTMVFIARKDLKLSAGKLAAQVGHATADCITKAERNEPRMLDRYMRVGQRKVVCQAANEDELRRLFGEAKNAGIIASLITDAGHTEIPAGTVTVVGLGPNERDKIDSITGSLPLLS
uniref:Peptidyl-tRNA hydrolase n=1 Tax=uncultured marine group II/III euryarchaeote KM3_144_H10 TaxID=1457880 RepID=A0A075GAY6_9EURY|nr:peptidyl-tRNA hydrolase (PTH2) [uncultured marine group II/III euryarchaeote KM3_144_H10]